MYNCEPIINVAKENGCEIFRDQPMSKYTSFKIGGPADVLIKVNTKEVLSRLIKECNKNNVKFFILGNGSNILVSDLGIRGVVFKLCGEFSTIKLEDETKIKCGTSVSLAKLCSFALENSLSGLEFAWGIPGSTGGAVFMNAGAYGGEMKDVLVSCEHIDQNGDFNILTGDELDLGYRKSAYTSNECVETFLTVNLKKGDKLQIKSRMDELMKRRKDKQPLEMPSAGSIFKRPEGNFAGTLIQECGLKGEKIGGAMVSPKHGNFIVNCGNATCKDVLNLIYKIQKTVFEKKKIFLECEVRVVGEV